ncbi:hypothetical protein [Pseudomonas sp. MPB26]|uniref:hypothetical protein n=1 Tax=Pseudomonas sp. MPB26 TaxID=3388491 RepID=UPI0039848D10
MTLPDTLHSQGRLHLMQPLHGNPPTAAHSFRQWLLAQCSEAGDICTPFLRT